MAAYCPAGAGAVPEYGLKLSIIQISSYYPPHLGGQENVVHDLAHQLAYAGHTVEVLTSVLGGGKKGVTMERDVLVDRIGGIAFGHAPIMPRFPLVLFRMARPDSVVHLHIGQAFTPEMVWLVSKLRHFKYVAELHIDFEPSGPAGVLLPLYKHLLLKHVLQSAYSVIVLNDRMEHIVREVYGYKGKISIMCNGIDEAYFRLKRRPLALLPPQTLRLLFVGRFSKQKNLVSLLRAVKQTQRDVHLDLVGDGEERSTIERVITEEGLTNVVIHGKKERQEVMQFYQTCDVLIMPSLYEAQPLVLIEAMAARIPIIGTNVIGVADHIQSAGIIVESTVAGLCEGIEQYYARYSLLQEMTAHGYVMAEKFRWRHALKEYETLYEAILAD